MIDGMDTAGSLGDSDGVAHNNSFSFTIAAPAARRLADTTLVWSA